MNIFGQPVSGGAAAPMATSTSNDTLPDGTSKSAFLRQCRATFLHMQTMNSSSNLNELRRYFTPELYQAIQADIQRNTDTAEFPQLNTELVEAVTENGKYIASVRYSGTVSESLDAAVVAFSEVWHFVKPTYGGEWLVAGIQQD